MFELVVVLGAAGPAGFNVCKAASAAGYEVIGVDANPNLLPLIEGFATAVHSPTWLETKTLIGTLPDTIVLPQPDSMVMKVKESGLRSYLPSMDTLRICQSKAESGEKWAEAGIKKAPIRIGEPFPDYLHLAKDAFGLPFWLRAESGAGAKGATLVPDLRIGHHWLSYWKHRKETDFVAEAYLPGREYCWSGLYSEGKLIAAFTRERLEWIYPNLSPSGRTGTPSVSVIVHDQEVSTIAQQAISVIDKKPSGVFCVDLVEDEEGMPTPTEINAGRWATTSPLYSELGANLVDLQIRLGVGDSVEPLGEDIYPEGAKLIRHIDMGHTFASVTANA